MVERNLDVVVSANTRGFSAAMTAASTALQQFRTAVEQTDQVSATRFANINRLAQGISVALLAAGVAASGAALDFDRNMTQIETLVGIAGDTVDSFRDSVLNLAGETARSPAELSEALFTVTSAGLRGKEALDALELSAQASAIGLGETRAVAQLTAGALNAYRASGLDAAEATDILVATVRAGNFSADQLAGALGRVLPNAATLKVGLEEVGGAIALLTRTSGNASLAVTGLDSLLRAFIKPTEEARDALSDVGISFEELQQQLADEGLLSVLFRLDEAFEGNRTLLAKVITDTQGLTAANQILNATEQELVDTFGAVAESSGMLGDAFGKLADSDAFKFDQAVNQIQTVLVSFGTQTLPIVAGALQLIADALAPLVAAFQALPTPVRDAAAALLLMQAAGLPIVSTLADLAVGAFRIVSDFAGATRATRSLSLGLAAAQDAASATATGIGATNIALLAVTAAATAGVLIWREWSSRQAEARARADDLTNALAEQAGSAVAIVDEIQALNDAIADLAADDAATNLGNLNAETDAFIALLTDLGTDGGFDLFSRIGLSIRSDVIPAVITGTDAFEDLQKTITNAQLATVLTADNTENLRDKIAQIDDANVRAFATSLLDSAIGAGATGAELQDLLDVLDESADSYDDVTKAQRDLAAAEVLRAFELGNLTAKQKDDALVAIERATNYGALVDVLAEIEPQVAANAEAAQREADAIERGIQAQADWFASTETQYVPAAENAIEITEDLIAAGQQQADQIIAQALANSELARSYDRVEQAADPFRQLLDALVPSSVRITEALNDADITVQQFTDRIGGEDGLAAAFRAGGAGAAEAENELINFGRALQSSIVDLVIAGASAEEVADQQDALRAAFLAAADQMGLNEEAAEEYAEALFDIPPEVLTALIAETDEAQGKVDALVEAALEWGVAEPEALLRADALQANAVFLALFLQARGWDTAEFAATLTADPTDAEVQTAIAAAAVLGYEGTYIADLITDGGPEAQETLEIILGQALDWESTFVAELDAQRSGYSERRVWTELNRFIGWDEERKAELVAERLGFTDREIQEAEGLFQLWQGTSTRTLATNITVNDVPVAPASFNASDWTFGSFADGGIVEAYARGGIRSLERFANGGRRRENHVAQIAPAGAWRLWAEPETGGEAYIPLAPAKRRRSEAILDDVARRFGYGLTKMADGAVLAMQSGGTVSFSGNDRGVYVDVVVNVPAAAGAGNVYNNTFNITTDGSATSVAALEGRLRRIVDDVFCDVLGEARASGARGGGRGTFA